MKIVRIARCLLISLVVVGAHAGEVRVFVAGAAKAAFEKLTPEFQRTTGDSLQGSFDTVGALRERIIAGEKPDLALLSGAAVEALIQRGLASRDHTSEVGVVVSGLAVRRGTPVPDISTVAALKQTLLAAKTIAQADGARGATSGAHFSKVIDALGLREQLSNRLTMLPFGVDVIHGVAEGKFDIGVSQSSEIVPLPEVTFVGGLPEPHSLRTTYVAVVINASEPGLRLLRFIQTGTARAIFEAGGFSSR